MLQGRTQNTSKKTDFPVDYVKMVKDVIQKNFKSYLKDKEVIVEGLIFTDEVVIRIGFRTKNTVVQKNFEASVDFSTKKKDILEKIYLAMDALGAMIDQYFKADGEIELPTLWTSFDLDGKKVYLQTNSENSDLEAQADEILKNSLN